MKAKNLLQSLLLLLAVLSLSRNAKAGLLKTSHDANTAWYNADVAGTMYTYVSTYSNDNMLIINPEATKEASRSQRVTLTNFNVISDYSFTSGYKGTSFDRFNSILAPLGPNPGGIAVAPTVWYKPSGASTTGWLDESGQGMDLAAQGTPIVNPGDAAHNFNSWTTGYSTTSYYNYNNTANPIFGAFGDTAGSYHYSPLTVFSAAKANSITKGLITGIDNEANTGSEPGFGMQVSGGHLSPRTYRFSNGIDQTATTMEIPIGQTSIYHFQPPAATTGTGDLVMGLNGTQYTATGVNAKSSIAGPYFKIGYDGFTFGAFPGDIQEVIWYKAVLNTDEINKVETYFAIKYGASLTHNYEVANGSTVFDLTINNGYTSNIAGIGREAANGNLDQRQSNSTSVGKQVLIGTLGLSDNNSANTVDLATDGQYLIWGDNGLAKKPIVPVTNVPEDNFRFASVWKIQNTGAVGTVRVAWPAGLSKLKLLQGADPTFAAGNTITDMSSNTTTVNGVMYNYADVSLTDGSFFTLAAFVQAPGGVVDGLLMWHKANDGTATSGAKSEWQDVSGNDRTVTQNNNINYEPSLQTDASYTADQRDYFFNFNPFYYFDGTNDFFARLNDNYFPSTTSAGTAYGVMYGSTAAGYRTVYGWGDDDPNFVKENDNLEFWRDNGLPISQNVKANDLKASIGGIAWKGADNGLYLNVNGRVYSTSSYNIGGINNAGNFAIGSEGAALTGNGNEVFQGGIAEVFAYSQDLQNAGGNEKVRVNSYLAIKYGITLSNDDGSGASDYMSSSSTVVWDAVNNAAYSQNIAGIAFDYPSALDQRQSLSENSGKQVIIGTTGLAGTNAENTSGLTVDGQYLVWGDNGLSKSPGIAISGLSNVNYRFKAVWKVQNTGSIGTVRVAWPAGLKNLTLVQSTDPTFVAGNTATAMGTTLTLNGKDYNYADVTLANGQYFTFAAQVDHAPGGVANGLTQWYRADIDAVNTGDATDVTTWTDISSNTQSAQINGAPLPKYKTGAANYFNFNPGINFTATNQMIGNITVQTLENTNFDIISLTKEGMAGTRYFNIGEDNTTFNGNNWDYPGLYANGSIGRRRVGDAALLVNGFVAPAFSNTASSIMYNHFVDTSVSKGLNGALRQAPAVHAAIGQALGGHIFGSNAGKNPPGGDDGGIIGSIGELIVYGADTISQEERNRVESYLAVKYGVTLDAGESYLNSAAAVVWDKTASANYYNNVAGIARDDISLLNQKQSISANPNTNGQVTIGLTSIEADNVSNSATFTANQTWLLWGDNGLKSNIDAASTAYTSGGNSGVIMTRIWRMQNTGLSQPVDFSVPQSMVSTANIAAAYYLITADDEALSTNVSIKPLIVSGTNLTVNFVPKAGQTYFGIARLDVVTPVDLKDFKVAVTGCQANVSWIGATETNFKQYNLQTSTDGTNFQTTESFAGQGNGSYYHTTVAIAAQTEYVRLQLVNKDGSSKYSDFKTIKSNCLVGGSPVIYPNPASSKLNVTHLGIGQKTISLYNSNGVRVYTETTSADQTSINVQKFGAGVYLATITSSNGKTVKLKVIIK